MKIAPSILASDFAKLGEEIQRVTEAGADIITFHVEAEKDISGTIRQIKSLGKAAGLSIKPGTPVEVVLPYLEQLDLVLVMTVEPGFGGQAFMPEMMEKVQRLRAEIDARGLQTLIEVDGGINESASKVAAAAGVDICVAGTSLFKAPDMAVAMGRLR